tara:strand:+ start:141 stop:755 length:615 start_codon:yes stop_codon:yes gene_type:complete
MKPNQIDLLIKIFSNLQGIGPRSARRIVLQLIKKKKNLIQPMASTLLEVEKNIKICKRCGNYDSIDPCQICEDHERNKSTMCIVEDVSDLWAIERSNLFRGIYYVIGGTLNAFTGDTPEKLNLNKLFLRLKEENIEEIILATSVTTSGQTTAHYILNYIKNIDIKVTRLARGIPAGGELDYIDDATLGQALNDRTLVFQKNSNE